MGTWLFLVSITEVKGNKNNLRLRKKQLELTGMVDDILVCDFELKRDLCNEIRKPMNGIHSWSSEVKTRP